MRGGRLLEAVVAAGACLAVGPCAWSASNAPSVPPPMAHLGLATQPVPLPGVGQIIFVFICVAALAVGIAAVLRRYGPGLGLLPGLQPPSGVGVTIIARQRLEPGVTLHIVSVAGERLAIVTSRSGVAVHTLSVGGSGAPAGTDSHAFARASSTAPPGERPE
jgi:hypothetical protein